MKDLCLHPIALEALQQQKDVFLYSDGCPERLPPFIEMIDEEESSEETSNNSSEETSNDSSNDSSKESSKESSEESSNVSSNDSSSDSINSDDEDIAAATLIEIQSSRN